MALGHRAGFGIAFGALGSGLGAVAALQRSVLGVALLGWSAAALLGVAVVYLADLRTAFGKRGDGRMGLARTLPWAPFLLFVRLIHELQRVLLAEDACNEVAPGLWVGRRPRCRELPPGVALVVDLCAELPAARGVPEAARYLALPVLDATAPPPEELARLVDEILRAPGPVLVHCAAGHGRSAAVAAAAALARGDFPDLPAAEAALRRARAWIRLNREQRAALLAAAR